MVQLKAPRREPVKVFIAHSTVDTVFARQLRNLLVRRVNAKVFMTEDLSAGEKWQSKLRNELTSADVVLALLTPHSVDSSWLLHEIGAAWALNKNIISVVTRRDVLNSMPVSLERAAIIELPHLNTPDDEARFVDWFEETLAATAH